MMRRLIAARRTLGDLVQRHGGGLRGLYVLTGRTWKMGRVLGIKGVIRRFRGAAQGVHQSPPPSGFQFPAPASLAGSTLRVGVMAHVFYPDLAEELSGLLRQMPVEYVLLVSVVDEEAAAICMNAFGKLPNQARLSIKVVKNRGRDIAPFFVSFKEDILCLDVVAHVHTKKSLYTGSDQSGWRNYLQQSLLGGRPRISWILGMFLAEPKLGIVYPESFTSVPLWAHTWLGNVKAGRALAAQLSIAIEPQRYFDFPAGSMFWARVEALRPLLGLNLSMRDFPEEHGQTDGTTQHAFERLLVLSVRNAGFISGVLPADGALLLTDEGARNWHSYFQEPVEARLQVAAFSAGVVSVDIFDTLVTRPFLYATGARAYLADLARSMLDVDNFASLRQRAEQLARARTGLDVDLEEIYEAMRDLDDAPTEETLDALRELELQTEARTLKPRQQVLRAVAKLRANGRRVVAISDMYLNRADLQRMLPGAVWAVPVHCYVSCETQVRKDDGSAWAALPAMEGVPASQWLHVGDNERADIQLPQDHGYMTPIHVLRPETFLDVVPALRPLRLAKGTSGHWQDQLMTGLLTRHLADVLDRDPRCVLEGLEISSPHSLGYLVLGPLITDYTCWLVRLASEIGAGQVLFLAREGHLLHQAFKLVRQASSRTAGLRGDYLLASRRGAGMPSLSRAEDIEALLGSTFQGTLRQLLESRFGQEAASVVARILGPRTMEDMVFLPDMRLSLQTTLSPAVDALLEVADDERSCYLEYWTSLVGDDSVVLADIGYSGTIQKLLSRLTGRNLDAAYFAVNGRIEELADSGSRAWARYGDARNASMASSEIFRYDLLLEALLTAPHGQFLRFRKDGGNALTSEHAPHDVSPQGLRHVEAIHQGAMDFVRDACEVLQEDISMLEFDPALVQTPLRCLGEGTWKAGPWLAAIMVEDSYTGRGTVSADPGHSTSAHADAGLL